MVLVEVGGKIKKVVLAYKPCPECNEEALGTEDLESLLEARDNSLALDQVFIHLEDVPEVI